MFLLTMYLCIIMHLPFRNTRHAPNRENDQQEAFVDFVWLLFNVSE